MGIIQKGTSVIENKKRLIWKIGMGLRDGYWLSRIFRYLPLSYLTKMFLDALPKPSYAFGVYSACYQAKALGLDSISVLEFGVASGKGLRSLEKHAQKIGAIFDINVNVYGFDIGSGLVDTGDYRDIVYWFEPTIFKVDIEKVRRSLKRAKLVVGDVALTVQEFQRRLPSPIGFVSFDLDHYTATKHALQIFDWPSETRLPRVACYFDDIFGISDLTLPCEAVGEERAICEFNRSRKDSGGIYKITGLRYKRAIPSYWNEQMYVFHDFHHPLYNKGINQLAHQQTS